MRPFVLGAGLFLGLASPIAAQCGAELLLPPSSVFGAEFGNALSEVAGGLAVGAWRSDAVLPDAGIVHSFSDTAGAESLSPADSAPGQRFGRSLSSSGSRLAVGADGDAQQGPDSGAVYLFDFSSGTAVQQAKLLPENGASEDLFGRAVALHGDRVLVGAPGAGAAVQNAGTAYLFQLGPSGWEQEAQLHSGFLSPFASYGRAVALTSEAAFVGAPNGDRVHVFQKGVQGWQETQVLQPSLHPFSGFGTSLAVSGTRLVVGAHDPSGKGGGLAYVYDWVNGKWVEQAVLQPPKSAAGDRFGASVDLDGDLVLVGAPGTDGACPDKSCNSGGAHLFRFLDPEWVCEASFTPCVGSVEGAAGGAVLLAAQDAVLGAPGELGTGAAWTYSSGAPWPPVPTLTAVPAVYSLGHGAPQSLTINAGPEHAGRQYLLLGSLSQRTAGFPLGAVTVPLGLDSYFLFTYANPFSQPLSKPFGLLGPGGKTSVKFLLAPGTYPNLVGTKIWHAAVVFDIAVGFAPDFATNAVSVELAP